MSFISLFFFVSNGCIYKTQTYKNISYGQENTQKVDICIPKTLGNDIGLIVMLHGGSWQRGDKSDYSNKFMKESAEKYGVMTASMNYRLISPDPANTTSIYEIYDDITSVIKLCVSRAEASGKNVKKVMLRGFSAGAHLALMYSYRAKEASPVPVTCVYAESAVGSMMDRNLYYIGGSHQQSSGKGIAWAENLAILGSHLCRHTYTIDTTKAIINEKGDTLGWTDTPDTMDENAEYIHTISPAHSVTKDTVPTLLTHGKLDTIVPYSNILYLVNALKENNVKYDFITSEIKGHTLHYETEKAKEIEAKYKEYINTYLK